MERISHLTALVLSLVLGLGWMPQTSPVAEVEPKGIEVVGAETETLALVDWALSRFHQAGLDLPDLVITFHEDKAPCSGNAGSFVHLWGRWPARARGGCTHNTTARWAGALPPRTPQAPSDLAHSVPSRSGNPRQLGDRVWSSHRGGDLSSSSRASDRLHAHVGDRLRTRSRHRSLRRGGEPARCAGRGRCADHPSLRRQGPLLHLPGQGE